MSKVQLVFSEGMIFFLEYEEGFIEEEIWGRVLKDKFELFRLLKVIEERDRWVQNWLGCLGNSKQFVLNGIRGKWRGIWGNEVGIVDIRL